MSAFVEMLRPRHWVKNLLCFAGLVFSMRLFDPSAVVLSLAAFVVFCALASSAYVINDLSDRKGDRMHPEKAGRPIARGAVAPAVAWVTAGVLLALAALISLPLNPMFKAVAAAYFLQNVAYSLWLKRIAVLDVMIVASGFLWRAVAGVEVLDAEISPWLVLCSFSLALFLAVAKRRSELIALDAKAQDHRPILSEYSAPLMEAMLCVSASAAVVSYALYTIADETVAKFSTHKLIYTTLLVIYGVFRYLYLAYRTDSAGSPTEVFWKDRPTQANLLIYTVAVLALIYYF